MQKLKELAKALPVVLLATFVFLVLISPTRAAADQETFTIGLGNDDLVTACSVNPADCGPYGTLTLTLVGNQIHVNLQMNAGFQVASGGGSGAFAFDVASGITGVSVSGLPATGGWTCCGSGQLDGFGNFQYVISSANVAAGSVSDLQFTVSSTQGFTSVSQMVVNSTGGNGGFPFEVHVVPTDGRTGFATVGNTPEPSSMFLFGSGLIGIGAWLRRSLGKKQSASV